MLKAQRSSLVFTFYLKITNGPNKLECFVPGKPSSLVHCNTLALLGTFERYEENGSVVITPPELQKGAMPNGHKPKDLKEKSLKQLGLKLLID